MHDPDEFPLGVLWVSVVPHVAGGEGEDRVVAAYGDVFAGVPDGAALAVDDHAGFDELTWWGGEGGGGSVGQTFGLRGRGGEGGGSTSSLLRAQSLPGTVFALVGRAGGFVRSPTEAYRR